MELEDETKCPLEFKHKDLKQYNKSSDKASRHASIEKTKQAWKKLSGNDKNLMVERLIKASDFKMGEDSVKDLKAWNDLYKDIAELASDIHQGKLMSVLTFNINDQDFSSINFFGKAWQEGVQDLPE